MTGLHFRWERSKHEFPVYELVHVGAGAVRLMHGNDGLCLTDLDFQPRGLVEAPAAVFA